MSYKKHKNTISILNSVVAKMEKISISKSMTSTKSTVETDSTRAKASMTLSDLAEKSTPLRVRVNTITLEGDKTPKKRIYTPDMRFPYRKDTRRLMSHLGENTLSKPKE